MPIYSIMKKYKLRVVHIPLCCNCVGLVKALQNKVLLEQLILCLIQYQEKRRINMMPAAYGPVLRDETAEPQIHSESNTHFTSSDLSRRSMKERTKRPSKIMQLTVSVAYLVVSARRPCSESNTHFTSSDLSGRSMKGKNKAAF